MIREKHCGLQLAVVEELVDKQLHQFVEVFQTVQCNVAIAILSFQNALRLAEVVPSRTHDLQLQTLMVVSFGQHSFSDDFELSKVVDE